MVSRYPNDQGGLSPPLACMEDFCGKIIATWMSTLGLHEWLQFILGRSLCDYNVNLL